MIATAIRLPEALTNPRCYPHLVDCVTVIETHISWVLLTGDFAYKIKKPVNLGFLDFTTLESRRRYCEEELRLNRRLAPELYLEVVAIAGTPQRPQISGPGPAIEYAVKMKEFPQSALLGNALASGGLILDTVEKLARKIANFHAQLVPQDTARSGDTRTSVLAPARDNFEQMSSLIQTQSDRDLLGAIRDWTLREYDKHMPQFEHRYAEGRVRECHGDLHAGNIALIDGAAIPFDCIEFNPALRWMDVMSEAAFLMMDLEAHGRRDLAFAFINAYLETSGDYAGIRLLPFYFVYRAVVRAKVNLIRAVQTTSTPAESRQAMTDYRRYITLAHAYVRNSRSAIIITHGFSGSGKTTLTRPLLGALGAVRVRSDIERKRSHGLNALAWSGAAVGEGLYTDGNTARTYEQLLEHARVIAGAGFPVIVDATFLRIAYRAAFHALALALGVPFAILHMEATPAEMRARLAARAAGGSDASDATLEVLEAQIRGGDELTGEELSDTVIAADSNTATLSGISAELARRLLTPLRGQAGAQTTAAG